MIVTDNPVSRATTVCVLTLLLCLVSHASGEYGNKRYAAKSRESNGRSPNNDLVSCEDKCDKRKELSGMWFGPRLGRRRRSDPKQDTNAIMALANALEGARLAVLMVPATIENRQMSSSQFVPRLGRESSEDLLPYEDAIEKSEFLEDEPPIFSPRLGRRPWSPSPRLGRQLRVSRKV